MAVACRKARTAVVILRQAMGRGARFGAFTLEARNRAISNEFRGPLAVFRYGQSRQLNAAVAWAGSASRLTGHVDGRK